MVQTVMSDVACSRVSDHSWSRGSRGVDFAFRGTPLWAQTRPDRPISDDYSAGIVCYCNAISSHSISVPCLSLPAHLNSAGEDRMRVLCSWQSATDRFYSVLVASVVWAPRMCSIPKVIGRDVWEWDAPWRLLKPPPRNWGRHLLSNVNASR